MTSPSPSPSLTATLLTPPHRTVKDVLFVGAGLGTGVKALWQDTATLLADHVQVIGWDLPGHGSSAPHHDPFTIDDLARSLAGLIRDQQRSGQIPDSAKIHVAGVSVSGIVSLRLALSEPDLCTTVSTICSAAVIGEPAAWLDRARTVEAGGTPTMMVGSAERWFAPGFIAAQPDRSSRLLHSLQNADRSSYARVCEALAAADLHELLPDMRVPVLALNGELDLVCPPSCGESIADSVPDGRTQIVPGVAHQAPLEAPQAVAELLKSWFADFGRTKTVDHGAHYAEAASLDAAGTAVRREVLGDAHVDRANASADSTTSDFQDLITRYAWGSIWTRPGLDRRMRSAVTISAMVTGGYWEECAMHLRAALRNGLSREEITEILLQLAIYSSVPAANIAFKLAQDVFAQVDADLAAGKPL